MGGPAAIALDALDRDAPLYRPEKCGDSASRKIALSSSASAQSRFNHEFSCSSSFSRFA
jgi:hypothetical protein